MPQTIKKPIPQKLSTEIEVDGRKVKLNFLAEPNKDILLPVKETLIRSIYDRKDDGGCR